MTEQAGGLSPLVPLIFLTLTILTAAWGRSAASIFFPAAPAEQKPQLSQKRNKKKDDVAATTPSPPVQEEGEAAAVWLSPYKKAMILALCWGVTFMLIATGTFSFAEDTTLFDPYRILNITQDATKSEIKRVFRTLSFALHPDRLVGKSEAEKSEAESKFIQISKAYKTLTDDEAMKNYLEYGHPDGPRSNSISFGIPAWMLEKENEGIVVVGYLAVFGLMIFAIAKKVVPLLQALEEEAAEGVVPVDLNAAAATASKKKA